MKAVLCKEFGPPEKLVVEEVPSLKAGKGQVVVGGEGGRGQLSRHADHPGQVSIQARAAVLARRRGGRRHQGVGEGVGRVKLGDRVIAASTFGGFAQEMVVDADKLIPMADGMDFVPASGFVLTYGTSYHALKDRAQLQAGETLLVLGASGGVGLAAIQIGKAMGARVIAAASSDAKLELQTQRRRRADQLRTEDLRGRIKAITAGRGVDVVYDPVGGPYSEQALRDTAWKGRFLVVGFAAGDIPKMPLNLALLKGCSIVGVFWGAFTRNEPELNRRNNEELMQMYTAGKIKPHIHATYPLYRAAEALNEVLYKRVSGKVVLVTGR